MTNQLVRTSSVGDSSAPNFGGAKFHFEAAPATLETAVLKVNVVLVRLHTKERAVKVSCVLRIFSDTHAMKYQPCTATDTPCFSAHRQSATHKTKRGNATRNCYIVVRCPRWCRRRASFKVTIRTFIYAGRASTLH